MRVILWLLVVAVWQLQIATAARTSCDRSCATFNQTCITFPDGDKGCATPCENGFECDPLTEACLNFNGTRVCQQRLTKGQACGGSSAFYEAVPCDKQLVCALNATSENTTTHGTCTDVCDFVHCPVVSCPAGSALKKVEGKCCPQCVALLFDERTGMCEKGIQQVSCFVDPCQFASCPAKKSAKCVSNYCGGCNALFYDVYGYIVNCSLPEKSLSLLPGQEQPKLMGGGQMEGMGQMGKPKDLCNPIYNPVCGADGQTYTSPCHAKLANVSTFLFGECSGSFPGNNESQSCSCANNDFEPVCGTNCTLYSSVCDAVCAGSKVHHIGACNMSDLVNTTTCGCGDVRQPVCTTSGKQFSSACFAECAGEQVAYEGECRQALPADCICAAVFAPVCGKSGTTHSNQCVANCMKDEVVATGPCMTCACPKMYAPVCSSNNEEYANECLARCAGAVVAAAGPCENDAGPIDDCVCTQEYQPVCGVTGKTYSNMCEAHCARETVVANGICGSLTHDSSEEERSEKAKKGKYTIMIAVSASAMVVALTGMGIIFFYKRRRAAGFRVLKNETQGEVDMGSFAN
eukprot:Colp12_sorted_trinity150504_noHs@24800